jgi:hypothetical protein
MVQVLSADWAQSLDIVFTQLYRAESAVVEIGHKLVYFEIGLNGKLNFFLFLVVELRNMYIQLFLK